VAGLRDDLSTDYARIWISKDNVGYLHTIPTPRQALRRYRHYDTITTLIRRHLRFRCYYSTTLHPPSCFGLQESILFAYALPEAPYSGVRNHNGFVFCTCLYLLARRDCLTRPISIGTTLYEQEHEHCIDDDGVLGLETKALRCCTSIIMRDGLIELLELNLEAVVTLMHTHFTILTLCLLLSSACPGTNFSSPLTSGSSKQ
jgi:hypothetical protein